MIPIIAVKMRREIYVDELTEYAHDSNVYDHPIYTITNKKPHPKNVPVRLRASFVLLYRLALFIGVVKMPSIR